jgi:Asp-tRNA(Asn)/Glu-tRNA(Gln) amidotransferase A subunit family amidase
VTEPGAEDLHFLELLELAALIRAGDVSPVTVARAQLDRIADCDPVEPMRRLASTAQTGIRRQS